MRPALSAREIPPHGAKRRACMKGIASMRPALSAREIGRWLGIQLRPCYGPSFNEARAFCAGNRGQYRRRRRGVALEASMRPALSAREISAVYGSVLRAEVRVASMRPALSAREIPEFGAMLAGAVNASMRPALSAREIEVLRPHPQKANVRFNEARAFCAGNRIIVELEVSRNTPLITFNEARAFCAGNL